MKIGSVVTLLKPCLGNPVGTVGVCYEVYSLGITDQDGCSFIFANGNYDGFSKEDQELFLKHEYDSSLVYNFTNVMKLSQDFKKGVFSSYLLLAAPEDKIVQQVLVLLDATLKDVDNRPWSAKQRITQAKELLRKHFIA